MFLCFYLVVLISIARVRVTATATARVLEYWVRLIATSSCHRVRLLCNFALCHLSYSLRVQCLFVYVTHLHKYHSNSRRELDTYFKALNWDRYEVHSSLV